jgi:hypothetical protein
MDRRIKRTEKGSKIVHLCSECESEMERFEEWLQGILVEGFYCKNCGNAEWKEIK